MSDKPKFIVTGRCGGCVIVCGTASFFREILTAFLNKYSFALTDILEKAVAAVALAVRFPKVAAELGLTQP